MTPPVASPTRPTSDRGYPVPLAPCCTRYAPQEILQSILPHAASGLTVSGQTKESGTDSALSERFGLHVGHGKAGTSERRRIDLTRAQPRQCADDRFPQASRLRRPPIELGERLSALSIPLWHWAFPRRRFFLPLCCPPSSLAACGARGGGWPIRLPKMLRPSAKIPPTPSRAGRGAVRAEAKHQKGLSHAHPTSPQPKPRRQVVRNGQLWKTGLLLSNTYATVENEALVEQLMAKGARSTLAARHRWLCGARNKEIEPITTAFGILHRR